MALTVAADTRLDRIGDLRFYQTERGRRIATRSLASVRETAVSGHVEARWRPADPLGACHRCMLSEDKTFLSTASHVLVAR
jgi:hypothetical protein